MMGAADNLLGLPRIPATLLVDLGNGGARAHYVRGKFEDGKFAPVGRQESHALFGLSRSNALLRLEPGAKISAGTTVMVEMWD